MKKKSWSVRLLSTVPDNGTQSDNGQPNTANVFVLVDPATGKLETTGILVQRPEADVKAKEAV